MGGGVVPVALQEVLPLKSAVHSALTRCQANTLPASFHIFDSIYTDIHQAKIQTDQPKHEQEKWQKRKIRVVKW